MSYGRLADVLEVREVLLGQSGLSWGLSNLLEAGIKALELVESEPCGSWEFCFVLLCCAAAA